MYIKPLSDALARATEKMRDLGTFPSRVGSSCLVVFNDGAIVVKNLGDNEFSVKFYAGGSDIARINDSMWKEPEEEPEPEEEEAEPEHSGHPEALAAVENKHYLIIGKDPGNPIGCSSNNSRPELLALAERFDATFQVIDRADCPVCKERTLRR